VTKPDQSIPDEDNISITLKYQNGSTAIINYYAFGNSQLPKEQIELFAPDIAMKLDNFRELEIFKGGKSTKLKNSNQDKGFKGEFKALKNSVENGELAISFDEMYSTSKVTFAILNALKTGEPQKL
jgi:predicted dehydrogenase